MRYFIADQHFFHSGVLNRMDQRGFPTLEEMHEHMISQWNSRVTPRDEVYILGDFSLGNGRETGEILRHLHGRKYLIAGNHDRYLKDPAFDQSLFRWVKPYEEIIEGKYKVCLCHYPIMCYNGQYHRGTDGVPKTFMLFGHVHNTYDDVLVRQYQLDTMKKRRMVARSTELVDIPCNLINCFCMFSDYVPLTLDEWRKVRVEQLIVQQKMDEYATDNAE